MADQTPNGGGDQPPKWSKRQTNTATGIAVLGLALWIGTAVLRAVTAVDIDLGVLPPAMCVLGLYVVFNLRAADILDFLDPGRRRKDER